MPYSYNRYLGIFYMHYHIDITLGMAFGEPGTCTGWSKPTHSWGRCWHEPSISQTQTMQTLTSIESFLCIWISRMLTVTYFNIFGYLWILSVIPLESDWKKMIYMFVYYLSLPSARMLYVFEVEKKGNMKKKSFHAPRISKGTSQNSPEADRSFP